MLCRRRNCAEVHWTPIGMNMLDGIGSLIVYEVCGGLADSIVKYI
jgi:hypothetical protein